MLLSKLVQNVLLAKSATVELNRENMLLMQLQLEIETISKSEESYEEYEENSIFENTYEESLGNDLAENEKDFRLLGCSFPTPSNILSNSNIDFENFWSQYFSDTEQVSWNEFEKKLREYLLTGQNQMSEMEADFLLDSNYSSKLKSTIDFHRQDLVSIYDLNAIISSVSVVWAEHQPLTREHTQGNVFEDASQIVRFLPLRYVVFLLSRGLYGARILLPPAPFPLKNFHENSLRQLAVSYSTAYSCFLKSGNSRNPEEDCWLYLFQYASCGILEDNDNLQQNIIQSLQYSTNPKYPLGQVTIIWGDRSVGKTSRSIAAARSAIHNEQLAKCRRNSDDLNLQDALYFDLKQRIQENEILSAMSSQLNLRDDLPFWPPQVANRNWLESINETSLENCLLRLFHTLRPGSIIIFDHVETAAVDYLRSLFDKLALIQRQRFCEPLVLLIVLNCRDSPLVEEFIDQSKLRNGRSVCAIEIPLMSTATMEELIRELLLEKVKSRLESNCSSLRSSDAASQNNDLTLSAEEYLISTAMAINARNRRKKPPAAENGGGISLQEKFVSDADLTEIMSDICILSKGRPGHLKMLLLQPMASLHQLSRLRKQKASLSAEGTDPSPLTLQSLFFDCSSLGPDERLLVHCLSPILYRAYCAADHCDGAVFSRELAWQLSEGYFYSTDFLRDNISDMDRSQRRFLECWARLLRIGFLQPVSSWPLQLPSHQQLVRFNCVAASSATVQILSEKRLIGIASQFPFFCNLTGCGFPDLSSSNNSSGMSDIPVGGLRCFEFDAQVRRYLSLIVRIFRSANDLLSNLDRLGSVPELLFTTSLVSFRRRQLLRHIDYSLLGHFEYVFKVLLQQLSSALKGRGSTPRRRTSSSVSSELLPGNNSGGSNSHDGSAGLGLRLFPPWSPSSQSDHRRGKSRSSDVFSEESLDYQETYLDSNRNDHQLLHPRTERSRILTSKGLSAVAVAHSRTNSRILGSYEGVSISARLLHHTQKDFSMLSASEIFQLCNLLVGHFGTLAVRRLDEESIRKPFSKLLTEV